ncbi:hypothetical protein AMAG_05791 [Allomyces macrogynus ATCC 38327]|uniref:Uncharacterized protein n=1 Tax=Allomyces macrogynus (strain ATCC 38327) TaxID=578462 RepID=A0A0L0SD78_ALLM3|nr:hypothetical protein AMAG_05791 [Allomyces macrogynus ATCC 38327]|eukprot:KNE60402.1 hypothetical protein AMAG_05791 [Allomyces macrogynus ATCC 38327]
MATAVPARQPAADSQDNARAVAMAYLSETPGNGRIVALGDSFYRGARPSQPDLVALSDAGSATGKSPSDAFTALASFADAPTPTTVNVTVPAPTTTGGASNGSAAPAFEITSNIAELPVHVRDAHAQVGNNLKLGYSFQLKRMPHWYPGHVNAHTGQVEPVTNWAAAARYPVTPIDEQSPDQDHIVIVDPGRQVWVWAD